VLVNRNKLTRYYYKLPEASAETTASTERYKVFNETLARTNTLLFPKLDSTGESSKKKGTTTGESDVPVANNTFELLSSLIEKEPEYEFSASELWQNDDTGETKHPGIADDSVADAVALDAYVTELQTLAATIRETWIAAAAGDLPLAVAEWVTSVAQAHLRRWERQLPIGDVSHEKLFKDWSPKCSTQYPEAVGFSALGERDEFLEFTHGLGLHQPYQELLQFRVELKTDDELLAVVERRKFEDYSTCSAVSLALTQDFVKPVLEYVPTSADTPTYEHKRVTEEIIERRYGADRALVRSLFRSLQQHSLKKTIKYSHPGVDPKGKESLQVWTNLKDIDDDKVSGSLTRTSCIVGPQFFLESCRTFLPRGTSKLQTRSNNKIRVFTVVNTVRRAMNDLLKTENDPYKQGTFTEASQ
jgi:hypothetical protein